MSFDGQRAHAFVLLCKIGVDAVILVSEVQSGRRGNSPKIMLIIVFNLAQYTHHQGLRRKLAVVATQSLVQAVQTERREVCLCSVLVVLLLCRSVAFWFRVARQGRLPGANFLWRRKELLFQTFAADRGERRCRRIVLRFVGTRVVYASVLSARTSRWFAVGMFAT